MKVIIAGDAGSIFVRQYVEHILLPRGITPVLACDAKRAETYLNAYRRLAVTLLDTAPTGPAWFLRLPLMRQLSHFVRTHWALRRYVRTHGKADVLHFHSLFRGTAALFAGAKRYAKRVVVTYWGSDLLRAPDTGFFARRLLDAAHAVSVSSDPMAERFSALFAGKYDKKLRRATFGAPGFEAIDRVLASQTPAECKAYFGFPQDKLLVAVGYNASPGQQHMQALDALEKLPDALQRRLYVALPLSYGGQSKDYLSQLQARLASFFIPHRTLTNFMPDEELARFRVATDIFLHAQTTDAFSASVQEHLYTGHTLVFSPSWIPYPRLDALGVQYFLYPSFEALPGMLADSLKAPPSLGGNREKLHALSSFEAVRPGWLRLYEPRQP